LLGPSVVDSVGEKLHQPRSVNLPFLESLSVVAQLIVVLMDYSSVEETEDL
jgi:hypothetical protein